VPLTCGDVHVVLCTYLHTYVCAGQWRLGVTLRGLFRIGIGLFFMSERDPIMDEICTIDGCEKPVNAKGLCAMHYARQRRKKVPTVSKAEGRLEELVAMRAVMAKALDAEDTPARELPALVRRMIECSELIESLEAREAEAREDESARSLIDAAFDLGSI